MGVNDVRFKFAERPAQVKDSEKVEDRMNGANKARKKPQATRRAEAARHVLIPIGPATAPKMRFELGRVKTFNGVNRVALRAAELQQRDKVDDATRAAGHAQAGRWPRISSAAFFPSRIASSMKEYFHAP